MTRIVQSGQGTTIDLEGRRSREVIAARDGAASSTFRVVEIDPGPVDRGPHVHDDFEEVIHVLQGTGLLRTDTGAFPLTEGDTCLVPPGVRHAAFNTGETTLRLLCYFPVNSIGPATREFPDWSR